MKSIYKFLFLLAVSCSVIACADLDDPTPINSLPSNVAILNEASARAALNGVYDEVQDPDLLFDGWLALAQFFSDEANATGTFPTRLEFGNLNVQPSNTTMAVVFTDLYDAINVANGVIERIPLVEDESFSEESRADITGQAKFIRAFCYLHLTTLWRDVPLILMPTEDVGEVLNVSVSSQSDIYAQIRSDLAEASRDIAAATGPLQASKLGADALLARVDLYNENWSDAYSKAVGVLGGEDFDLTTFPYLSDQIYSLGFTATDGNTLNFFYGPSDFGGRYSIGPTTDLISAFEPGDARFAVSIDTTLATPYGLKYPSFDAGISGTATDPIFFVRHAEMVLIAAEAAAEQGDFDLANKWLNQVRSRAGLDDVELDDDNFVDAILKERFTEFAFEGPFRLIDLRRKGKALEVLGPLGYEACDDVWPLPQRDVDRNINLTQNDCCNC